MIFLLNSSGTGACTPFFSSLFHSPESPMVRKIFGLYFHFFSFTQVLLVTPPLCTPLNSFSLRQLFVFYTQASHIFLVITILSFSLLSFISPCSHFITYVVGLLWYPFNWSSFSKPMDTHMLSHHGFICLQAASKACTESVIWHGSEPDVFHLEVPLQSGFLHRHSGEDVHPKFQFSAWSFNISSFWDHW